MTWIPTEKNPVVECACGCGTPMRRFDMEGVVRTFIAGHGTGLSKRERAEIMLRVCKETQAPPGMILIDYIQNGDAASKQAVRPHKLDEVKKRATA